MNLISTPDRGQVNTLSLAETDVRYPEESSTVSELQESTVNLDINSDLLESEGPWPQRYRLLVATFKENQGLVIGVSSGLSFVLISHKVVKHYTTKAIVKAQNDFEAIRQRVHEVQEKAARSGKGPLVELDAQAINSGHRSFQVLHVKNPVNDSLPASEKKYFFYFQGARGEFSTGLELFSHISNELDSDVIVINTAKNTRNSSELYKSFADITSHLLEHELMANPSKVTFYGISLGAGVATHVTQSLHKASPAKKVRLIADRGFNSMSGILKQASTIHKLPSRFLPQWLHGGAITSLGWNIKNQKAWDKIDDDYKMAFVNDRDLVVNPSNQLGHGSRNVKQLEFDVHDDSKVHTMGVRHGRIDGSEAFKTIKNFHFRIK